MSDYIDRQKAIEVCDWYEHEFVECEYAIRLVADDLKKLPSADAEPVKHGRWIDAEIQLESGGSMPIQACSLCKTFYPLAYTGGGHRFCPNCGARMDGEADG